MLSLYIHTPFCDVKCDYCSFHVLPTKDLENEPALITEYVAALKKEISEWSSTIWKEEIKTIYFWWGTPTKLWTQNLIDIILLLDEKFDLEDLGELTIECNPEPPEQIYDLIKTLHKTLKKVPRIRLSVGIQTFDNDILKESGRQYNFNALTTFLRTLQKIKQYNVSYNLDFIAFGKWRTLRNGERELWRAAERDFLEWLIASQMADSFSAYTLELFPWSTWYNERIQQTDKMKDGHGLKQYGDDDEVYDEFNYYKELFLSYWYKRYELSNFALQWKSSVHNRAYWEMESYLWLWSWASSFINKNHKQFKGIADHLWVTTDIDTIAWMRWSNTKAIKKYLEWDYADTTSLIEMNAQDYLIEEFFLSLRTDSGISNLEKYQPVLVADYKNIVAQLSEQWFVETQRREDDQKLLLTDQWMDVYNEIITSLLEHI